MSSDARQGDEEDPLRRPSPSAWEQIRSFPEGCKRLFNDMRTYQHIVDAAKTPNNEWKGTPPRRQQAFQRKLSKELRNVAVPVVGYVILPIIGNAFVVLAIAFPRVFLSWHFLTISQVRRFANDEHSFRVLHRQDVADFFWDTLAAREDVASLKRGLENADVLGRDSGGPVYADVMGLLDIFTGENGLGSIEGLPDSHLLSLIRSSDALRPPFALTSALIGVIPSRFAARQLDSMTEDMIKDDALLLDEGHADNGCSELTVEELIDAILLRGLPADMSVESAEMRRCLTNHLCMVRQLPQAKETSAKDLARRKVFLLHLPAIRENAKRAAKVVTLSN